MNLINVHGTVALVLGERRTSYQFILHTESTWNKKADWTLAAQTEGEMKDWILAFKVSINCSKRVPSIAIG
jgi:hypothetical protein